MAFWHVIWLGLAGFGQLFLLWLSLFTDPFKNFEVLWLIIPIWLNWFFTEWFQEKDGTSFGNAISNGVIVLWVGIDWLRYLTKPPTEIWGKIVHFDPKIWIASIVFIYGATVIIYGVKVQSWIHIVGRIREVTYVLLMFTPIIYGIIDISWEIILAIVLFFPLFYYIIEYIDRKLPDPESIQEDEETPSPKRLENIQRSYPSSRPKKH